MPQHQSTSGTKIETLIFCQRARLPFFTIPIFTMLIVKLLQEKIVLLLLIRNAKEVNINNQLIIKCLCNLSKLFFRGRDRSIV